MDGRHPALEAIGKLPDAEIDLAGAALQLGRIRAPDADWAAAERHLSELARQAARIGQAMRGRGLEARVGAIAGLLHGVHGYSGDRDTYDDLDNSNLIRVIERRRGLPVSLGILWLHCARAAGWQGRGLDTPGHFLLQLDGDPVAPATQVAPPTEAPASGGRATARRSRAARRPQVIVDAFSEGGVIGMNEVVGLVRGLFGAEAEIGPGIVRPVSNRSVLLRLQRNATQRLASMGRTEESLDSLVGMIAIAPEDPGLWREAATLNQAMSRPSQAIACLERFLDLVPSRTEAARAARARLDELRAGRAS